MHIKIVLLDFGIRTAILLEHDLHWRCGGAFGYGVGFSSEGANPAPGHGITEEVEGAEESQWGPAAGLQEPLRQLPAGKGIRERNRCAKN